MRHTKSVVGLDKKGRVGAPGAAVRLACALLAAAAAGCACPPKAGAEERTAANEAQAPERVVEVRSEPYRPATLARPDLSADWNWNGQALPTGDPATSVIKIEKMTPVKVNANSEYEYKIRVTNIAQTMHLVDVAVMDRLPTGGYVFTGANPAGERAGDKMSWNVGRLAPGEVREIVVRGRATTVGAVKGCASVAYTPLVCGESAVVAPSIELKKTAPGDVTQCDAIPLRFVVRNTGTGDARNVKIADQLPDGWTVDGGRAIAFEVGVLKAGESREFNVVAYSSKTGSFVGRATATADDGLFAEASTPTVVRKPVLEIVQTADFETQYLGRDTVFTITVKNSGDCAARDFTLEDVLSGAERIVSVSDAGVISGAGVTVVGSNTGTRSMSSDGAVIDWRLGSLAAGASRSVTFTVNRATEGLVASTATAASYCAAPVSASAKVPYRGVPALLTEVVDDVDPVPVGGTTNYTITVTNQGTATDTDIVVTCALEDFVQFVSGGGATKPALSAGVVTFGTLTSLAPKETAIWTLTVRGVKPGDSRMKVEVNTKETGREISKSESTRIYK